MWSRLTHRRFSGPAAAHAVSEIVGHTVRQMAREINPATKCTRANKLAEPAESLYGLMIGKHELAAIARKNEDGARVDSFESLVLILKLHP
jgi:hypothetical protein